jgi:hypothetical protein
MRNGTTSFLGANLGSSPGSLPKFSRKLCHRKSGFYLVGCSMTATAIYCGKLQLSQHTILRDLVGQKELGMAANGYQGFSHVVTVATKPLITSVPSNTIQHPLQNLNGKRIRTREVLWMRYG